MKLVRDGLYIGNINDGSAVFQGKHPEITHLLSVLSSQILYQENPKPGDPYSIMSLGTGEHVQAPQDQTAVIETFALAITPDSIEVNPADAAKKGARVFTRMTVPLRDMESENLLDHLEASMDFIEKGRKNGRVLVHCLAGVSRSAAVILAYLMRTERLSVEDALTSLRESSASACPNAGFMDQLQMFEDMGYKVDHGSSIYKTFHVTNLGEAYGKGEKLESSRFASDPGDASSSLSDDLASKVSINGGEKVPTLYRCKKCRRLVASESNVVTHNLGLGESSFKTKRKGSGRSDDYGEPKCSSIFVEPMQWMTAVVEGDVEGKLLCARCEARLGNFNWAGLQCSCGAWVNPAFQLHKSRMDFTWL
ncbi:hypothetical protein R1flu_022563 [Riccia fluitans]|uniref:protein-tyrosine-phosphatase n=1 Tax=Riccia fluitans TaxID=41844 RepID=A0ABD1XSJ5_9MARC